jgi:hypothetical protein
VTPPGSFESVATGDESLPAVLPAIATTSGFGTATRAWLSRRLFPLLATAGLIVVGMSSSVWFGPRLVGSTAWALPNDLWGTLVAAQRLAHLDLGGLYTQPTGLISLPGTALILVPVAALIGAAGFSLDIPGVHNPQPAAWLLAGPYVIVVSAVALFAADAVAERLGVTSRAKRAVLAGAEAVALWSVTVRWGHPEDAVAVGLLMYGMLALSDGRLGRSGWLVGAAVAVQPLVLLAVPVVAAAVRLRRMPGFLARAAAPAAVLLGAAAWANWHATYAAVTSQPNSVVVNHPTPWTPLSPHLGQGMVAGGPGRILAVVAACACALAARRWVAPRVESPGALRELARGTRREGARGAPREGTPRAPLPLLPRGLAGDAQRLENLVWWAAAALALRSVFESVMVAYYVWPTLALAMAAASNSWRRLVTASVCATVVTSVSQGYWRSLWTWWLPVILGLGLTLVLARYQVTFRRTRSRTAPTPG